MTSDLSIRRSFVRESAFWLVVLDLACLAAAVWCGITTRQWIGPLLGMVPLEHSFIEYFNDHRNGWILFCLTIVVANYIVGNYKLQSTVYRFNLLVNWVFSLSAGLIVVGIFSLAWFQMMLGRGVLMFSIGSYAVFSLLAKALVYEILPKSSMFVCRTVLLGTGSRAQDIRRMIEGGYIIPRHVVCGYVVVPGAVPQPPSPDCGTVLDGAVVTCTGVDGLENAVRELHPDLLVMCSGSWDEMLRCFPVLRRLRFSGIEVLDSLNAFELFSGRVPLDLVNDVWMMQATMEPSMAVVRRVKRLFDIVVTCLLAVIMVPVALLVAFLIKLSEPCSPVLYVQNRVGQFGRVFRMYKFRTMVVNAEAVGGAVWSPQGDQRVTRLGRVLRKFRLDEIPQLWDVIAGKMSLVGPRPERPEIVAELEKQIPNYRERENVPPGITGWAQVRYPYADSVEDVARKLEYDLYYIKNLSIRLDFQIILRTVRIVMLGKER